MVFVTGDVAAAATGQTIAEIDELAATGEVPAAYLGWQLRVDVPIPHPEHPEGVPKSKPLGHVATPLAPVTRV